MRNPNWAPLVFLAFSLLPTAFPQTADVAPMQDLKRSLDPAGWTGSDPCSWANVRCNNNRVTVIQLRSQGLKGNLPETISSLTGLERLELQFNGISGPLPSLKGFSGLKAIYLNNNNFSSVPPDFFSGMTSLETVYMDYNPFSSWELPDSLKSADQLREFSANSANLIGKIPEFFGSFVSLTTLHLAMNSLEGGLPANFSGSSIQSLWVNGQNSGSKLNGSISVLQNMTQLAEVWLHGNQFSGPLPDFSGLTPLQNISFRDNLFTGPVPDSLIKLPSLKIVNLTNNLFQGPTPAFGPNVEAEITGINSFCLPQPGVPCDPRVNAMLLIGKSFNYPQGFAKDWQGNDPCSPILWSGLNCVDGKITMINFSNKHLTGTISPNFSNLESLLKLFLNNNGLTGTIPDDLTKLKNLSVLDVSNNQLYGKIPLFRNNVIVNTKGNIDIGKDTASPPPPRTPGGGSSEGGKSSSEKGGKNTNGVIIGSVVGVCSALFLIGLGGFCLYRGKRKRSARVQSPNTMVVHPRHSGSDQEVKITIANNNVGNNGTTSETHSLGSNGPSNVHVIEAGNMVIEIQILREVTNDFSENNILGRGGFGTVYKGELHDGTKIAVKRMESGVVSDKGLDEFKSEIAVLTKVRHKNLVTLVGYCLDGNERLLVYEYMPQGTLSRYLFDWKDEGLRPLEWSKRLTIALDVARGVEYLHSLARESFIHRDLKPTNILLGDDLRAKVADFGLVRLAPEGKVSLVTRLAGTFGYLAPEYAVTGRVTTKVDVFSFGVILMELITGRKALDETQPEDSVHLVTWFRRMHLNKESFLRKAVDPSLSLSSGVATVAELAGHCTAREPSQRPDMGHAVNVLSSLAEMWRPAEAEAHDDPLGIDFDLTLPQALKKWALEDDGATTSSSSYLASGDNTQTSLPNRPSGFAASFTSADGR